MSSYKVSARKYRPQKFSEVTSQDFATQTLKNAIVNKKFAHSYLLSGPRGVGKTTIARIFAKALNCQNPKDGEPCNKCDSCIEITSGTHPDIFELDAASNRGIDDVRAIQDAAKFYPIKGKYKFFIVDEVHMLTQQAFNALLKILEEPPEYLIFILATTNPEKIPTTITSRCQRFPLQRIKVSEISDNIKKIAKEEKVKIDEESLFLISKLGDGAMRDALGIFDMAVSFCGDKIEYDELKNFLNIPDKEIYFTISNHIREGNSKDVLLFFNELNEKGFDLQMFFHGVSEHFRNLMVVKSTGNISLIDESDSIKDKYLKEAENFSSEQISRLMKVLFETETRFRFSANQKIIMEALLDELCRINSQVLDLSVVLSELESVKKKTLNDSERVFSDGNSINFSASNDEPKILSSAHSNGNEEKRELSDIDETDDKSIPQKSHAGVFDTSDLNEDKKNNIQKKETELVEKLKELFDVEEYKIS